MKLAARKRNLLLRARMVQSIRAFFIERGYLEIDTPQLISAPAPDGPYRGDKRWWPLPPNLPRTVHEAVVGLRLP